MSWGCGVLVFVGAFVLSDLVVLLVFWAKTRKGAKP